ncbi:MAG: phosphoenolpyruvate--protein phosphotransferase, partial [Gammaproteobacteria bacterium]|nr:phosphoenolpyruvate--protein phosphotransferase [Gammaproteobacteria bacterium]
PFDHGLHARPAARVAAALARLDASVTLRARGREADARSTVAMMALGVERGEIITASVSGPEAGAAVAALSGLLNRVGDAAAASDQTGADRAQAPQLAPRAGTYIEAVTAARGLAVGYAAPMRDIDPPVMAASGSPDAERERLLAAIAQVGEFLGRLAGASRGTQRGVLDAHRALLADPALHRQAGAQIANGASAGAAWRATLRAAASALAALDDARMAERRADLLDIERQVVRVLAGASPDASDQLPEQAIVLASELLPSQLLTLDSSRLAGLCMAAGGASSHVAIIAAALGIPTLVAAGESVLAIKAGTPLILDAEAGRLLVDPPAAELGDARARIERHNREREQDAASARQPARMRDGIHIHVYGNLGAAAEAAPAVAAGAEGCGLLRTEFLFLDRTEAPGEAEQLAEYQAIAAALGERTLTIRTLDAGGDKPIAYLPMPREENPALGLRGLRTSQLRPELLAVQLRAIMRVEPAGRCRVLLPMVTEVAEVREVRALLAGLAAQLGARAPALGVMIETPSSALLADQLCAHVDFLSIGSNDLSQYTLAMDRQHPTLASRLDALHPAVLRLIQRAADAGTARGIEVGVCGGLASDPAAVPLLLGLGVRELSAVPAQIPRIKSLVRRLALADCSALARAALELEAAAPVRELVREWSIRNG